MGVPFTDVFLRSIFLVSSSGGGLFDGRPVTLMSLGAPFFSPAAELAGRFCHLPDLHLILVRERPLPTDTILTIRWPYCIAGIDFRSVSRQSRG